MHSRRIAKVVLTCVLAALLQFILPLSSAAQAWVPPKGEGDFTFLYQNLYTRDHIFGDGVRHREFGRIRLLGIVHVLDYGLTDKLAVSLSVPFGLGKYSGRFPHRFPIDNGNYHGTFQDFGLGVRYNVRTRPLVLTPFIRITFPTHHYQHFAHSAIGSSLWETQFGIGFGRRLDPILPNAYFQTRYSYALSQKVLGIRPNRSRTDVEFGYFLTRRLAVRALAFSQITHGGLDALEDFPSRTDERWIRHDQISTINLLNVGGGFSYSLTNSWDVFSSMVTTVWGQNGHAFNMGLTIGVNWSFRTRRAATQFALASDPSESSVAAAGRKTRCTCK